MTYNDCPACGESYANHLGLHGTCEMLQTTTKARDELHAVVDRWQETCGLVTSSGDPDGISPEQASVYWKCVEKERDEALAAFVQLAAIYEGAQDQGETPIHRPPWAQRQIDRWTVRLMGVEKERDEARAEVDRLLAKITGDDRAHSASEVARLLSGLSIDEVTLEGPSGEEWTWTGMLGAWRQIGAGRLLICDFTAEHQWVVEIGQGKVLGPFSTAMEAMEAVDEHLKAAGGEE